MIVVRTRSRQSLRRSSPVLPAEAMELDRGAELVTRFEGPGSRSTAWTSGVPPFDGRSQGGLREMDDVAFAGGVLRDPDSGEPVIYSENLFVKFRDEADPGAAVALLAERGLEIKRRLRFAANSFFVGAPEGVGQEVFAIAQELLERDEVEYCHPELLRRRRARAIAPQQWHLQATLIDGVLVDASANVAAAHEVTEGEGAAIAVIDDGFDLDHVEFSGEGKVVAPREAALPLRRPGSTERDEDDPRALDPRPKLSGDRHGTACAGVACACGIAGASGVAPAARLMPIRSVEGLGSIAEAEAFTWAADHGADVISCSWGPADGDWSDPRDPVHRQKVPLPPSTRMAIDYATTEGRGGKGCVVLFAAGNGNESVDNDGYASYPGVIAVAACNDRGKRSVYSDFGAAVFCSFPSSDFRFAREHRPHPLTPGIWTVDRAGGRRLQPGRRRRRRRRPWPIHRQLRRHLERLPGRRRGGRAGRLPESGPEGRRGARDPAPLLPAHRPGGRQLRRRPQPALRLRPARRRGGGRAGGRVRGRGGRRGRRRPEVAGERAGGEGRGPSRQARTRARRAGWRR